MWSIAFLRGKAPVWPRTMLWTSSMRTATALRNMSGAGRSGYGPPLSWKVVSESWSLKKRLMVSLLPWIGCQWKFTQLDLGSLERIISGMDRLKKRHGNGSGFVMCSGKENPDSDADLDVDGDDTLEYGKPQYTEADVIPCTGEEPGEAKEREALRGAVLNGGPPSTRITPEFSKWASDEMPSTSNGESSKQEAMQKTCKNSDIEKITEDSAVTTFEALKARVRELERQLSRGDRYKCLICMDSYSMPLTSIQCWHVHCEECWLRTLVYSLPPWVRCLLCPPPRPAVSHILGAKKLCPQCNTITAPGDLRRIYL
uniref:Ring finger protein 220 n=1 Tax=Suricata suricatta TaxID=37032 RepID=A0A673UAS6_SURSU